MIKKHYNDPVRSALVSVSAAMPIGIALLSAVAVCLIGSGCGRECPFVAEKPAVVAVPPVVEVVPVPLPPKSEWTATASDLQEDIFPAPNAIDGDPATRWSSPASDPQWLQIDLGAAATVAGIRILWEAAFSSVYDVMTSVDGKAWATVYHRKKGDGNTDEVFFRPVLARYVRIVGLERGTGWGHSIWEVDLRGADEHVLADANTRPGSDALNLVDGDLETTWIAGSNEPIKAIIDLRKPVSFGGLRIDWGDVFATAFTTYVSEDGTNWVKTGGLDDGVGVFDVILHPRQTARYVRIDLAAGAKPIEIRDVALRGPEETLTPEGLYQIAAEKSKPGHYPDQLRRRQVYWTLVGLPGDREESALDEYGNFEAVAGSCMLMPYVYSHGVLKSAFDANPLVQKLENGYLPLPAVTWTLEDLKLDVQALTWGAVNDSVTFVRYTLSNTSASAQTGRFFLAVRPFQINPIWQHGGMSPIRSIEYAATPGQTEVKVNGTTRYILLDLPDGFGARTFDRYDIARELVDGVLPPAQKLADDGALISAAMAYDFSLEPGESRTFTLAAPLHGVTDAVGAFLRRGYGEVMSPGAAFEVRLNELRLFWLDQVGDVLIDLPDQAVADTLRSQVVYIQINRDGVAIQPGSRNYKRSWIRDGALTSAGLLRMGVTNTVREFLNWYADRIQPDGWVPPILNNDGTINTGFGADNEYDSQGQYIFAVMEYYRFTKDEEFLRAHFERIVSAMKYMENLRAKTLDPEYLKDEPGRERFVGILPPSISHEGYSPAVHSYWDDFFALKGWKDGKEAADLLGRNDIAAWAQEQGALLRGSLAESIDATIRFKKINFIPGSADKGDMDATSTTIAFFPCDENEWLPAATLLNTYEIYYRDVRSRLVPKWSGGYTPYEIRNISAFSTLGERDRANFLLDYIMGHRRPPAWNHLAEVVLGDERMGSYIGDMPHTWVGSGFINSVRNMLAREADGKLLLLRGVRKSWLTDKDGITLRNLPTYFGVLDLTAKMDRHVMTVRIDGTVRAPNGMELFWPVAGKPTRVTINGTEWTRYDDKSCGLSGILAGEIVAEWPVEQAAQ